MKSQVAGLEEHLPHGNALVSGAIVRLAIGASGEFLAVNARRVKVAICAVAADAASHYALPGGRHSNGANAIHVDPSSRFRSKPRRTSDLGVC
jgi:hypothetical protein